MFAGRMIGTGSVALAAALLLGACSIFPFPGKASKELSQEVEQLPEAEREKVRAISICYSNLLNTPEEVLEEAQVACGGEVTYRDSDLMWSSCTLLQPASANYICKRRTIPE